MSVVGVMVLFVMVSGMVVVYMVGMVCYFEVVCELGGSNMFDKY